MTARLAVLRSVCLHCLAAVLLLLALPLVLVACAAAAVLLVSVGAADELSRAARSLAD